MSGGASSGVGPPPCAPWPRTTPLRAVGAHRDCAPAGARDPRRRPRPPRDAGPGRRMRRPRGSPPRTKRDQAGSMERAKVSARPPRWRSGSDRSGKERPGRCEGLVEHLRVLRRVRQHLPGRTRPWSTGRHPRRSAGAATLRGCPPRPGQRGSASTAASRASETGLPILDHLVAMLATRGGLRPRARARARRAGGRGGRGGPTRSAVRSPRCSTPRRRPRLRLPGPTPADEALATVVLERSGPAARGFERRPVCVTRRRPRHRPRSPIPDAASPSAGLVVHVRLIEGTDSQHVLEAIFKALGVALSEAGRARP